MVSLPKREIISLARLAVFLGSDFNGGTVFLPLVATLWVAVTARLEAVSGACKLLEGLNTRVHAQEGDSHCPLLFFHVWVCGCISIEICSPGIGKYLCRNEYKFSTHTKYNKGS